MAGRVDVPASKRAGLRVWTTSNNLDRYTAEESTAGANWVNPGFMGASDGT